MIKHHRYLQLFEVCEAHPRVSCDLRTYPYQKHPQHQFQFDFQPDLKYLVSVWCIELRLVLFGYAVLDLVQLYCPCQFCRSWALLLSVIMALLASLTAILRMNYQRLPRTDQCWSFHHRQACCSQAWVCGQMWRFPTDLLVHNDGSLSSRCQSRIACTQNVVWCSLWETWLNHFHC